MAGEKNIAKKTEEVIAQQTQKTQQVISNTVSDSKEKPAVTPEEKKVQAEAKQTQEAPAQTQASNQETSQEADSFQSDAKVQPDEEIIKHLAGLMTSLKMQVRKEVLDELIPLMESLDRAVKNSVQGPPAQPTGAVQHPQAVQPQVPLLKKTVANAGANPQAYIEQYENLAKEFQDKVEQKIEQRRHQMLKRINNMP